MEEDSVNSEQQAKSRKSLLWIVGNIYLYIIIANVIVEIVSSVISKTVVASVPAFFHYFLQVLYLVFMFFVIRFAIKNVLKSSLTNPEEFLKIGIIVGLVPFIIEAIFSAYIIFINRDNSAVLRLYLIPKTLEGLIGAVISGIFLGLFSHYWLKKLSK
jgi:hypothetical protein